MKESPIFNKMTDFAAWVIALAVKFPREQRFYVATSLHREVMATQENLIRASLSAEPTDALRHLNEAATHLSQLRFCLRLSETLLLITINQYEYAAERLTEIGRLLQAWQKRCQIAYRKAVPNMASS
jgi:four helix bundle protein